MWIISYWVFPVISACTWLAMLLAMLIRWGVTGEPHYPSMEANQHIAYISDIGAFGLKPLFIAGCAVTTVFLDLGFVSERWLRHRGVLLRNTSVVEKVLSVIAIIFGIAGTCGLILLSIFDTYHHPHLHDGFLLLFLGGYIISAIFICAEYQRLGIHYRNHWILRVSFYVKLVFIIVEVCLAAVFIGTDFTSYPNIAAVFEWIIAFIFTFYVLSFLLDLLPSIRTKHHIPQGFTEGPMAGAEKKTGIGMTNAGPGEYESNLTYDSAGADDRLGGGYRGTDIDGHTLVNGYGSRYTNEDMRAADKEAYPIDHNNRQSEEYANNTQTGGYANNTRTDRYANADSTGEVQDSGNPGYLHMVHDIVTRGRSNGTDVGTAV